MCAIIHQQFEISTGVTIGISNAIKSVVQVSHLPRGAPKSNDYFHSGFLVATHGVTTTIINH